MLHAFSADTLHELESNYNRFLASHGGTPTILINTIAKHGRPSILAECNCVVCLVNIQNESNKYKVLTK